MAHTLQARHALLWSIIRAPTILRADLSRLAPSQTRPFHATKEQRDNGFSVTFGSEIDGLLNAEKRPGSARRSTRTITKRQAVKGPANVFAPPSSTSTPRSATTPRTHTDAGAEAYDASSDSNSPRSQDTIRVTEDTAHNEADTLELSKNAYEEISQPKLTSIHPLKPRQPSMVQDADPSIESGQYLQRAAGKTKSYTRRGDDGRRVNRNNVAAQPRKKLEPWQIQKDALQTKFGEEGWNPRKKLSPDAVEGIRSLHEEDPERYSTTILSQQFKVSPEAIRRILKSKWKASPEVMDERRARWARRHDRIWDHKEALGQRPPRKKDRFPDGPEAFEEEVKAKQMLGQL